MLTTLTMLLLSLTSCTKKPIEKERIKEAKTSFYKLDATTIKGETVSMGKYKGKNILVVNTASKCGYTYQYEDLEELSKKYKSDLVILGFPANDFFGQEPGSDKKIEQFCKLKYDISFPMFSKITVKGKNMSPIYKWLTNPEQNGWNSKKPGWNFNKYLIDKSGNLIAHFGSSVEPLSNKITSLIK